MVLIALVRLERVSTLVTLAGNPDDTFEEVVKQQIKSLRKSIDEGHESERSRQERALVA